MGSRILKLAVIMTISIVINIIIVITIFFLCEKVGPDVLGTRPLIVAFVKSQQRDEVLRKVPPQPLKSSGFSEHFLFHRKSTRISVKSTKLLFERQSC